MNFSEVLAEVLRVTVRPDKSADAIRAINKAVLYCTIKGDFSQDFVEASMPIDPTLYGDTISIATLPRFRRFLFVKPLAKRYYLTKMDPDKILTPKLEVQPNVYYLAGTNLTYTLSELNSSLEVGYYTYPLTLDAVVNPTHWMLDMMPYAIIDLAAAYVFAGIGDDASARKHEAAGLELYTLIRKDLAL